jgi:hypothetical protein
VEGKEYEGGDVLGIGGSFILGVEKLTFSPDSKRVAYVAARGKKEFVVVDGVEGEEEYDYFLHGSKLVFDSPRLLHALVCRGDEVFRQGYEIFRVEIEIVEE